MANEDDLLVWMKEGEGGTKARATPELDSKGVLTDLTSSLGGRTRRARCERLILLI